MRLHNDDIHTFEQVTKTLVLVGLTEAYVSAHTASYSHREAWWFRWEKVAWG